MVSRANRITVKLTDGREYEAKAVTSAAFSDVALLKIIAKPGEKFSSMKFAGDDELLLGETVVALGNPFGLGGSVSRGILSSKTRRPPNMDEPLDIPDWLQIDAAINPGNSGGPLINLRGELIGIRVSLVKEQTYFNADLVRKKLGVQVSELSAAAAARIGLDIGGGLLIEGIDLRSPAAKVELQRGMILTAIDGQKTARMGRAAKLLHTKATGKTVQIEVLVPLRRGRFVEVKNGTVELTVR